VSKFIVPITEPNIGKKDVINLMKVLYSGNLIQGTKVAELEKLMCQYFGVNYAVLVSSGTSALHLALLSISIGPGDDVITTPYSFIATANAIKLTGANVVFADTCKDGVNICSSSLESKITPQTKAILIVHEFGISVDFDEIEKISLKYNIPILEDSACAMGSEHRGTKLGTAGKLSCFSFHPRKIITCGEGGLIITNDRYLAEYVISMRNHGLTINPISGEKKYIRYGFNYRMTELSASLIIGQLHRIGSIINKRSAIAKKYFNEITNSNITFPAYPSNSLFNFQTFPILLKNRDAANLFITHMQEQGIEVTRPAQFIPQEPSFGVGMLNSKENYPNAFNLWERCVAIPLFGRMSKKQIKYVIDRINSYE